jgi:nicotinamidase-related amidase
MSTHEHAHIDPKHAALVVMDYQNGIIPMIDNSDELLSTVANVISSFREHGGTIGYVRVGFADGELDNAPATSGMAANVNPERAAIMHADGPATQIHEAIAPEPGDIVVRKQRVGAFSTTDLHEQLQARGIDTLILAGISTSGVVLSTVRDAADRDYRVLVLEDASADPDPEVHALLTAKIFPRQGQVTATAEFAGLLSD